jgi:hypothetical protein
VRLMRDADAQFAMREDRCATLTRNTDAQCAM